MKEFLSILNAVTWNSWKVVYQYCTGNYVTAGGHMSGIGTGLEVLLSFLFTFIELLLLVVGFLAFH